MKELFSRFWIAESQAPQGIAENGEFRINRIFLQKKTIAASVEKFFVQKNLLRKDETKKDEKNEKEKNEKIKPKISPRRVRPLFFILELVLRKFRPKWPTESPYNARKIKK